MLSQLLFLCEWKDPESSHTKKVNIFSNSKFCFQKLPEQMDLDKITEDCTKLRTQLQAVSATANFKCSFSMKAY